MILKFRYNKFPARPSEAFPQDFVLQPTLDVVLINLKARRRISCHALVDSGADFCIFHGLFGEAIGLDVRAGKTQPFRGITSGVAKAYVHEVVLEISGVGGKIPIGFSYDLTTPFRGLLGQRGFFELFKVSFNLPRKWFQLRLV